MENNIELNAGNTIEMTSEVFEAYAEALMEMKDDDAKALKVEIKKIDKEISRVGWKSEEGRELQKNEYNLKVEFLNKYGKEALSEVLLGKQSGFKLRKSTGNYLEL